MCESCVYSKSSNSIADVSVISDNNTIKLWQHRWDTTEVARIFHRLHPSVHSKESFTRILQLQTGYSPLNDYIFKVGQVESILYQCG